MNFLLKDVTIRISVLLVSVLLILTSEPNEAQKIVSFIALFNIMVLVLNFGYQYSNQRAQPFQLFIIGICLLVGTLSPLTILKEEIAYAILSAGVYSSFNEFQARVNRDRVTMIGLAAYLIVTRIAYVYAHELTLGILTLTGMGSLIFHLFKKHRSKNSQHKGSFITHWPAYLASILYAMYLNSPSYITSTFFEVSTELFKIDQSIVRLMSALIFLKSTLVVYMIGENEKDTIISHKIKNITKIGAWILILLTITLILSKDSPSLTFFLSLSCFSLLAIVIFETATANFFAKLHRRKEYFYMMVYNGAYFVISSSICLLSGYASISIAVSSACIFLFISKKGEKHVV